MLYQVTISTDDLSKFASLVTLLDREGYKNGAQPQTTHIISDAKPILPEPATEKKARKPREAAPVNHGTEAHPTSVPTPFDEQAYKASGVADATMALSKARGRDAVIALLADFGQTGDTPSARNIPQKDWARYVDQAKKITLTQVESSLV